MAGGDVKMSPLPMDMDILPPSDDRVFKLILTKDDAKPVLMDLCDLHSSQPSKGGAPI